MLPSEIQDLVRSSAEANPHDARTQTALLERINAMRDLMRQGGRAEPCAYLEAAGALTEALVHPHGVTHERLAALVSRFLGRVQASFALPGELLAETRERADHGGDPAAAGESLGLKTVFDQPLGEILIQQGCVSRDQVEDALRAQRATGMRLGELLVMLGASSWEDVHRAVRLQGRSRTDGAGLATA